MATTYVYGRFEKILVTREVPTAATMVNSKTGRVSMAVNPDFVKKCMLSMACSRRHRNYGDTQSRRKEFGINESLSTEDFVSANKREALSAILLHEFGHIFFGHLENVDDSLNHFLSNMVQDALLNYHLGVRLNLNTFNRMSNRDIVITALTDVSWAEATADMIRGYYYRRRFKTPEDLVKLKYDPQMDDEDYTIWRLFNAMLVHTGKGVGKVGLAKFLQKYVTGVTNYTLTHAELVNMVRETFPFLDMGNVHNKFCLKVEGNSVWINGEEYRPATKGDLPPIINDILEDVLKAAGVGGEVTEKIMEEIQDVRLKRATVKSLMRHSTKTLLGTTKKALGLHIKRDKRARTIIPNNRPVHGDLLLYSSLMLEREPRYYPLTAKREYSQENKRVYLFTDVSGSMMGVWPNILSFCRSLSKECDLRLYQFSTEVHEITYAELKEGKLKTTGGTDVTPVVEKIRELSQVSDAFIVIGDRYYSGLKYVKRPAKPLRLLDVAYNNGNNVPGWFKSNAMCQVTSVWLDDYFEVHEGDE